MTDNIIPIILIAIGSISFMVTVWLFPMDED
nr:MAG TPA: hypothetical protein [Caudoviricetes sp.]